MNIEHVNAIAADRQAQIAKITSELGAPSASGPYLVAIIARMLALMDAERKDILTMQLEIARLQGQIDGPDYIQVSGDDKVYITFDGTQNGELVKCFYPTCSRPGYIICDCGTRAYCQNHFHTRSTEHYHHETQYNGPLTVPADQQV